MKKPDQLFEVSWEVCNKVGGINTVIKSKSSFMDYAHYTLIGPYFAKNAELELTLKSVPKKYQRVFASLEKEGILCHYGTWGIGGDPETILLDFSGFISELNKLKAAYWEDYRIDSLAAQWEFDEPLLFSTAAGKLIELFSKEQPAQIVAHFHEWMTGFGLLYLKKYAPKVGTVFTTHATMLGRAISGGGNPLYEMLDTLDVNNMAYQLGVQDKHTAEYACAQNADVFTTVSEITGMEAEKILGRKPEVLLFNGLSIKQFPTIEDTSIRHVTNREKIRSFIAYYFFPYYTFAIKHTLIFYITARYEFRNKGLDILVAALAKLNAELKEKYPNRTIIMLFWIPMETQGLRIDLVESKNTFTQIEGYIDWQGKDILRNLTFDLVSQANNSCETLFSQEFMQTVKRSVQSFKQVGTPPITTHNLPSGNELANALLSANLTNKEDDRVKVVMYPAYLDGADGLLNLPYYEAIVGTNLGIFPSYYEPWGYTPVEAAALGVPAITTDLAGFGRFAQQNNQEAKGVFVLSRLAKSFDEEVHGLYDLLSYYAKLDHVGRVENRLAAKKFSSAVDWKHFVNYYVQAHNLALQKAQKR